MLADAEEASSLLMFGSYNIARTAEDNHYENVKFSNDKRRVAHYLAYFEYQRGLASAIDQDKLEKTLSRSDEQAAAETSNAETAEVESAPSRTTTPRTSTPRPRGASACSPTPTPRFTRIHKFCIHYFIPLGGSAFCICCPHDLGAPSLTLLRGER